MSLIKINLTAHTKMISSFIAILTPFRPAMQFTCFELILQQGIASLKSLKKKNL